MITGLLCSLLLALSQLSYAGGESSSYIKALRVAGPPSHYSLFSQLIASEEKLRRDFDHLKQEILKLEPTPLHFAPESGSTEMVEWVQTIELQIEELVNASQMDPKSFDIYVIGGSSEAIYHVMRAEGGISIEPNQFYILNLSRSIVYGKHQDELKRYLQKSIGTSLAANRNLIILDSYNSGGSLSKTAQLVQQLRKQMGSRSEIFPLGIHETGTRPESDDPHVFTNFNSYRAWMNSHLDDNLHTPRFQIVGFAPLSLNQTFKVMGRSRLFAHAKFTKFIDDEPAFEGFDPPSSEVLQRKPIQELSLGSDVTLAQARFLLRRILAISQVQSYQTLANHHALKPLAELLTTNPKEALSRIEETQTLRFLVRSGVLDRIKQNPAHLKALIQAITSSELAPLFLSSLVDQLDQISVLDESLFQYIQNRIALDPSKEQYIKKSFQRVLAHTACGEKLTKRE